MSYWTVAQTESQREHIAQHHLHRGGFQTYLPRVKRRRKLIEPLFPGYLFVYVIEQWYQINCTIGIIRVLLACDHPAKLRDDVLERIRRTEDRKGFIVLPKKPPRLGSPVRITRGSFLDHVGLYDGQSSKDREAVLLALLGRMVRVELPAADLQFV